MTENIALYPQYATMTPATIGPLASPGNSEFRYLTSEFRIESASTVPQLR